MMPPPNLAAAAGAVASDPDRSLSREELVDRLGEASGIELFERMDESIRHGDRILGTSVRAARGTFAEARIPGHARLVMPGRSGKSDPDMADELVLIAFSDLEAVVKANQADFDWAAEFAPRADLPIPTTPLVVRSGAPSRRALRP